MGDHFINNIKPCPFCGSSKQYLEAMTLAQVENYFIVCRDCGSNGPYSPLPQVAEMLWEVRQP